MYIPAHFGGMNHEANCDLIEANPLSILFTNGRTGQDANHIPFELVRASGKFGVLRCHVARANPIWKDTPQGSDVLAVFRSVDAYVSPNWYPSKRETHRQVPTWNYIVAHAHGRLTVHDDEAYVRNLVARLTKKHEATQPLPWKMADAPKDYLDTMVSSIVGLEIGITRLVGKMKLSQDDGVRDMRGAGEALKHQGNRKIANAMLTAAKEMELKGQ
jgi:transcriptional regulator